VTTDDSPPIIACDYCDENVPLDETGWHIVVDPDGFDGTSRIPCPRRVFVMEPED
jgi:hypothetical protein